MDDDKRCTAYSKQSGERCKRPRKGHATVCHMHGGNTPSVRARSREKDVEVKARRVLAEVASDFDPLGNPLVALEDMARRMIRFTDVLGGLVSELKSVRYSTGTTGEQLRAEVAVYSRALVDTTNALEKIARLDIDDRLAMIRAAQAGFVVRAVDAALDEVGAVGEVRDRGRAAAARVLRKVTVSGAEAV